jgi:hypothetical protein
MSEGRSIFPFNESQRANERKRRFDKKKNLRIKSRPNSVKVRGEKEAQGKKGAKAKNQGQSGMFGSLKKNLIVDDQSKLNYGYKKYRKHRPSSKYQQRRRK